MWCSTMIRLAFILMLLGAVASFDVPSFTTISPSTSKQAPGEDRIVGGYNASIEDHPYQVSFTVKQSYFCGGFIVSKNYILTAARCAQDVDPSTVVLRAGSSWRKNGTVIPIAEVTPHPEYDDPAFDKDVAVMKTVDPIEFNDVIQPIALPPKGRSMVANSNVLVSGWGKTSFGANSIPEQLMAVEITVVNHIQCMLVYASVLTNNEWCGGNFWLGGKGTCQEASAALRINIVSWEFKKHFNSGSPDGYKQKYKSFLLGDSGGAAIQDDMAVGIVSFGLRCAEPLSPSVFADIAAPTIRDFITEHTGL